MDNSNQLSAWDRTTTSRIVRWLISQRTIRRALIGLAWTATIVALFYGVANWRGRHAWNEYRRELEAQGGQLDFRAFIPKPVPDDQNFAATSFVQDWFPRGSDYYLKDSYSEAGSRIAGQEKDRGIRHFRDLSAWAAAFDEVRSDDAKPHKIGRSSELKETRFDAESRSNAAPAVIEGMKVHESVFSELRNASQLPYSRYPVVYDLENPWAILLPHLNMIKSTCQRLLLRACAELAIGQSEQALQNVELMLHLTDSLKDEPFLISYRVRGACVQIASQPIWEGLAEHRWTEAQLLRLQSRLQEMDFVANLKRPFEAEQAAGVLTVELVERKGLGYLIELGGGGSAIPPDRQLANFLGPMIPSGWYYQEQLNYCRFFQTQLEGAFDPVKKRVFPAQTESATRAVERMMAEGASARILHHHIFTVLLMPALTDIILSTAKAQTCADHAALACALERHRLALGKFPENLTALVPRYIMSLPPDLLTGESYKYRRSDDGQFLLYSIGWNEKDDGGVAGNAWFDEKQGDWVWRYPSKEGR